MTLGITKLTFHQINSFLAEGSMKVVKYLLKFIIYF